MTLIKSFSIYTFVGFLGSGISLMVMPILTHYLTPNDYGVLSLFNSYVTILIPVLSLTSTSILSVEYHKLASKGFNNLFVSSFIPPIIGAILCAFLLATFGSYLEKVLEISRTWILLLPAIAFLIIVSETLQTQLIIRKDTKKYSFFYLSKVILEVSLTLLFVIVFLLNWQGRVISWLIVLIGLFSIAILQFKKWGYLKGSVKKPLIVNSLHFGIPLIFHQLGKFVINQSDRIFLAKMVSIEDTGIYSVGYLIGSVILIVSNAGQKVFNPFFFERIYEINYEKKIEIIRFSYLFFLGLVGLTIFLNLVAPLIFKLFIDSKYIDGIQYIFWISISYLFWGGYLLFSNYIFYLKKTKILAFISLLNVTLNLLFNYFLIQRFGAIGAAYATVISFGVVFIIIIIMTYHLYPMPWFNFKHIFLGKK